MNLIDALRHHARFRPYETAVIHPQGAANFLQLTAIVAALADRLQHERVQPDTTAAIYIADPFAHLATLLALMLLGVRSVSSHPGFDPMPHSLKVDAWITDRPLAFATSGRVIETHKDWAAEPDVKTNYRFSGTGFADADAICRFFVTSGTTGESRVVGHTSNTLEQMAIRQLALEPVSGGPNLSMMWLSTIGGFGTMQTTLWHGATIVLAANVQQVLGFLGLYRVANLRASPHQLKELVARVSGRAVRFRSLERLEVGGSAVPASLASSARANFHPNLVGIYGSTEVSLVAQAPGAILDAIPDAAGYVVPGAQVRIVDDAGISLPINQEGHVQVRTPYMEHGYFGDAQATAASFRDGWFIPGDLGVLRSDGLLRVTGRADEVINIGGVKFSPTQIDEFLLTLPGVRDATTFAHRRAGNYDEAWAAVVTGDGFDEKAVHTACRASLGTRAPSRFIVLSEIPRNAMGKALRHQLSLTNPR